MTLQQAAFVAQCLRRWGYEAMLEYNEKTNMYRVFVCGGAYSAFIYNYGQAVNYR